MTAPLARLVLVRHGQTDWNVARRIQGSTDTELNARGHWQAQRLAERLAAESFSHVICSDARRAQQTLAPLAARNELSVALEPRLRERRYGIFEGQVLEELTAGPNAGPVARLRRRDPDFAPDGGETLHQVTTRAVAALAPALVSGASVLVVTHGAVLDCLYRHFTGLSLRAPRPVEMLNAALNEVHWHGRAFSVARWADDGHLLDEAAA
ncbi:MAG: histidine phosphatase family protein [Burkholderiaceae bacterium]